MLTAEAVEALLPCAKGPGAVRLAQFDKDGCASAGLVKLDRLSNRARSSLEEAGRHAEALAPRVRPSPTTT